MNSKISSILNHLSLLLTLFITVCLTKVRAQDCSQEELARCAKPLQVFQEDLKFAPKREELGRLCPDLTDGLSCISSYTRRCMSLTQRNQFIAIYKGTDKLIRELCRPGDYQDQFLKHSPCLQKVRPQHEICALRYQQTMTTVLNQTHERGHQQYSSEQQDDERIENVRTVCCSFREYLDCSEHVTRRICGDETGLFIKGFLRKMSDSLIKNYCEEYDKGSNQCSYQYSMASNKWTNRKWEILMSIALLVLYFR